MFASILRKGVTNSIIIKHFILFPTIIFYPISVKLVIQIFELVPWAFLYLLFNSNGYLTSCTYSRDHWLISCNSSVSECSTHSSFETNTILIGGILRDYLSLYNLSIHIQGGEQIISKRFRTKMLTEKYTLSGACIICHLH